MTPEQFIRKWQASTLKERSSAQSHFNDLCMLLNELTPTEADPHGNWYTFEKGAKKTGGGDGWADVWKRGHFAWEYKGKHKDLNAALKQLQQYALALNNPPLLIVSDMNSIIIHTNFTNTIHEIYTIPLTDLSDTKQRQRLKWAFSEPERLRPGVTTEHVTTEAAQAFAHLAQQLRNRGFAAQRVAHFTTKLLFCMFAEDIGLLERELFTKILRSGQGNPALFEKMARELFNAMAYGGHFGYTPISWFNGGIFNDDDVLPLNSDELKIAYEAALLDWSNIEPAIFGTLFERGLDPDKRSQLGAHYTDRASILRIIEPVIQQPLFTEWQQVKEQIYQQLEKARHAKAGVATKAHKAAEALYQAFQERLRGFRVLDPACGSGNFLYMALQTLKDFEHQVILEAEELGLQRGFPSVGPEAVLGIELNPYAAELARVTVWIGEIQWMLGHGYSLNENPILKPLNQIDCRDALLNADGSEASWPIAEVIIGNPPFLGDKKMLSGLGEEYVTTLRRAFSGRVAGGADLVTYWFEKSRAKIETRETRRVGLVATNSIRGGANRKALDRVKETGVIFNAWSDEEWVNEGASVRVSLVCFGAKNIGNMLQLNGEETSEIFTDLTSKNPNNNRIDLTKIQSIQENINTAFIGVQKNGEFEIHGKIARNWLILPTNPNGRNNCDVLYPWANGMDITRRSSGQWIIDFGTNMSESEAAFYEQPFTYIENHVKPARINLRRDGHRKYWWRHGEARPGMRRALASLTRYIATPRVAKHRLFVWLDKTVLPDSRLYAIARDDDTTFGILHSRIHQVWSLATCSWHGVGNDPTYNAHSCFETFPFPEGLTPNLPASHYANDPRAIAIATAAQRLVTLRDNWLNPTEWVRREPEVVPDYPDRLIPINDQAAAELKKRTLTNLYNTYPTWLQHAHQALDTAVAAAYGWPTDLSDDQLLHHLLELNQTRTAPPRP